MIRTRLITLAAAILMVFAVRANAQRTDFGTLSIQVRPPDADIFIDGERWSGSHGNDPLQVQLTPGVHRVELRAPGRRTFLREVTIRAGETLPLNVSLTQGDASGEPPPPPPPPPRRPMPGPPSGITRTTSEDGFVVAPDFKITEINHHTSPMIGMYGGYVFGGQFLIGAGGYWQAETNDGTRLAYGGPVLEWRAFPDRQVGFNIHGLIGGGTRYVDHNHYPYPLPANGRISPTTVDGYVGGFYPTYYYNTDVFFVAEPEAQIVVRFGSSARLVGGVGYRATTADHTSGVSGSIAVQFGR